ncbi:uncharacterized protein LOC114546095 [Perca flavescens]|uniref:uncharacterized protein LOC114546095 n=1 Tax=Perca flavescens TaxID=8167 RepID=UPI00106E7F07|nr:uncharacterized protein LOC114546095 [Perca flavescens]
MFTTDRNNGPPLATTARHNVPRLDATISPVRHLLALTAPNNEPPTTVELTATELIITGRVTEAGEAETDAGIIVIIAAADPTTITAEPAGKVARDPVAGPGREASSSHANSSHANGATTTTIKVTADVHRDAGNQGHRRETAGPEEQGELGGPPPRPLAQSSPAPPPTTTSPHASEDSTFSFVPPTPASPTRPAAQAEPQPDLDTDGLTEADVLGNMRARLEVLRSTTGEVVATEIPDPGLEALDPLSITISDVETPRRATVQPSRGQIITEAAQTSLLDRGLTFVPSIQRQTNKEVRDILRADLQSYHRHLKLAVYYQDRRDSIQLPFLPKSNWSPALAHLPSEVSHLIQLDMTALQNDYRVGWTKSNLSRYELEALDQLSSNNNLVIKPADKGSAVVILDREDYLQEGFRQLNNTYYYKKLDGPIFKQTIPMVDKIVNTLHAKSSLTPSRRISS